MEKYYEVTEAHNLHGDYFRWIENSNVTNEIVKEFMAAHEIEARKYYAANDALYIVATDKDKENFKSSLTKNHSNGLYKLKGNSKINKQWLKLLKSKNHKILQRPNVIFYMPLSQGGRFSSRLFDQDGRLYCSFDPAPETTPEGFIEMKASEFFKIIEEDGAA